MNKEIAYASIYSNIDHNKQEVLKKHRGTQMRSRINLGMFCFLLVIMLIGVVFSSFFSQAKNPVLSDNTTQKYYTSIQIEEGESLWTIAETYISSEYVSIDAYIKEVREINQLPDNNIYAGLYLVVPYYSLNSNIS